MDFVKWRFSSKNFSRLKQKDLRAPLLEVVGEEDEDGEEHGEGDGQHHQQARVNHSKVQAGPCH